VTTNGTPLPVPCVGRKGHAHGNSYRFECAIIPFEVVQLKHLVFQVNIVTKLCEVVVNGKSRYKITMPP